MSYDQVVGIICATILLCVLIGLVYAAHIKDRKGGESLDDLEKRYQGTNYDDKWTCEESRKNG